jgi:hypothetical protein
MNRLPVNNTNLKQALGIDNSLYNCFQVFYFFFFFSTQGIPSSEKIGIKS